ncbi:hypothetical protein COU20_03780 [Candidatus Kaiserbacteria bacterium CG10_big_fil_rev_8_21_14_0_10_59_10]|uniref:Segregation and condensation protein A n=1 Tax=Candidatus Kaiserbacteria bacterium CG10_big_fil_rev_8_21_14_0_10_59_10 TaxID=1974612 RepID=A0A2H0U746_9BACT|nr:MAG: hypothetical protein COU20_03780 [Candidatus Kaiserbacteria bacterium CG10_big_fil_rev_8_21_14_0_10_59_10]
MSSSSAAGFFIATERYQGPLEALLALIEARKLSITEVTLAEVCDAYIGYIQSLPKLPLGETSQFLVIASTLLLIKSRSLLPDVSLTEEETADIAELERRLRRYAKVRAAAKLLRKAWGMRPLYLPREAPSLAALNRTAVFAPGETTTIEQLHDAALRLISSLPKPEKLAEAVVAPVVALEEVITRIQERLASSLRARWSELTKSAGVHEQIVHFLAVLELVRSGRISASQDGRFTDITIERDELAAPRYGA